ncbi:Lipoyltransferase and lipoate-protein ligase [Macrolepiota fuliginosa MF-IS2]|uniref:Putative lipoate-protein ligase A n=1 Tax=Macrolepiota fuliginosa MF-IS2 TaxID=1400762 RepID=A0A9P5XEZ1_9AGAR|nr:Lipoyltransferase and lipoate-protein ligase [Macrolepiota fuliginosa MF-IS2]
MTFLQTFRLPRRIYPLYRQHRHYATSTSLGSRHSIYVSNSTNPYFNLTFEDWLFRHKNPNEPLLLIYRDEPCVIIGRNQNPWKEVNFDALKTRPGVPFVRRRSGGGTVYHDLGNTNFSIHLPRHSFDRHVTAQVVLRAVRALGVDARVNDRNDICVGNDKVSGSAYKIINIRAYHHGTMLISTRLSDLGDILRVNKATMITKGVASVRSPVCNIQQFDTNVDHTSFTNAVVNEFRKEYGINEDVVRVEESEEITSVDYIKKGMAELLSWEWAYGQTPEFTYTIDNTFSWGKATAKIVSKHGLIRSCTLNISESRLASGDAENVFQLAKAIEGQRYGFADDTLDMVPASSEAALGVSSWLKSVMS